MALETYRHRETGQLGEYGPGMASVFADVLEKVDPDAKPLAFTPIPEEAVAEVLAARVSDSTPADEVGPKKEDDE